MESIYLKLLNINASAVPHEYSYSVNEYDGYIEEYEEPKRRGVVESIPLERDIIIYADKQETENIEELATAKVSFPIKNIDDYCDGDIYKDRPIAASFVMDIHAYQNLVNDGSCYFDIAHFGPHYDIVLYNGAVVMAFRENGKMRVIAGFKQEEAE